MPALRLTIASGTAVALMAASAVTTAISTMPAGASGKIFTINAIAGKPFIGLVGTASCEKGVHAAAPDFTINWSASETAASTVTDESRILISGTNTYGTPGQVPGEVTGTYTCGTAVRHLTSHFQAHVVDAPLTATGLPVSARPGQKFSATIATFTDANRAVTSSQFTAVISWGDGATGPGVVTTGSAGAFDVTGVHGYAKVAVYPVQVMISHVGGSKATADTTASIATKPPVPVFTGPPGKSASGQPLTFDAAGSQPAGSLVTSYRWTLSGIPVNGRKYSAACGGDTSEMVSSFARAGTVAVTLAVSYASGHVSTVSHKFAVTPAKVGKISPRAIDRFRQWVLCLRGPADHPIRATGNGGPRFGCQDVYNVGIIAAIGCFKVLKSYADIPKAEYDMMCPYFWSPCQVAVNPPPGLGPAPASTKADQRCLSCLRLPPPLLLVLATSTVRVNGLDITPTSGSALVIDANDGLMADANDTITTLNGSLNIATNNHLLVAAFNVNGDMPPIDTNLTSLLNQSPVLRGLFNLSGFKVSGTLTTSLVSQASVLQASVTLPPSFSNPNGGSVTARIAFTASNQRGMQLGDLLVRLPTFMFDGFEFDDVTFCYQPHVTDNFCQQQTLVDFGSLDTSSQSSWNALGEIKILNSDIKAIPTMAKPQQGIAFVGGNFDFAGLSDTFSPPITLTTGLQLQSVGATLVLPAPSHFSGSLGLIVAGIVSINGNLFVVFASPSNPYQFTGSELGASGMPTPHVTTFAAGVGGSVGLTLPGGVGTTNLGSGYVLYVSPSYLAVGGNINLNLLGGALTVTGGVNGQVNLSASKFNVEGTVNVHVLFFTVNVDTVVSSTGIGLCASVQVLFFGTVAATVGYIWGGSPNLSVGSCDLSPYRVVVPAVIPFAGRAAAKVYRLRLPAGLPSESIELRGKGGAPNVTITGPGGIHLNTAGKPESAAKPFFAYRANSLDTTYLSIIKPPAGKYTIKPDAGSVAIRSVLDARGITPSVHGSVTKDGAKMLLSYDVRGNAGQPVTFEQKSPQGIQVIGTTSAAKGTITFTPAPGPAGTRQVVARFTENGLPVELSPHAKSGGLITVASFRAPGPRRLAAVSGLRVRHAGTRLLVRFATVAGARRYAITVIASSGQRQSYLVTAGSASIQGVFGEITGKVSVQAIGDNASTLTGPVATAAFGPAKGD